MLKLIRIPQPDLVAVWSPFPQGAVLSAGGFWQRVKHTGKQNHRTHRVGMGLKGHRAQPPALSTLECIAFPPTTSGTASALTLQLPAALRNAALRNNGH